MVDAINTAIIHKNKITKEWEEDKTEVRDGCYLTTHNGNPHVQIMHFYYFSIIALCALFDP
jgi:hypothetical protein